MHHDHDIFVRATKDKRKVLLDYFDDKHKLNFNRLCLPVYYSQAQTEGDNLDCYYLWDLASGKDKRFLGLPPSQIVSMELTEEAFDPAEFITLNGGDSTETKAGQHDNGSTVDSKESTSMKPAPEKDSKIAKLTEHLVDKIRQTGLSRKKEPAEDSTNTAGLNANTEKEN